MKKTAVLIFITLLLITVSRVHASSYIICDVEATVQEIVKPVKLNKERYYATVRVNVDKLIFHEGLKESSAYFKKYLQGTRTIEVIIKDKSKAGLVKKNSPVILSMRKSSGKGRSGNSYSSTVWVLMRERVDLMKNKPVSFEESTPSGIRYGYKDKSGNIIVHPFYSKAGDFSETGIALVIDNQFYYYINVYGQKLVRPYPVNYNPDGFSQGLSRYIDYSILKTGFINNKGEIVIKAQYFDALQFSEGLAGVCTYTSSNGFSNRGVYSESDYMKWGFVNKKGEMVIPALYYKVTPFKNGKAVVYSKTKGKLIIDKQGRVIE